MALKYGKQVDADLQYQMKLFQQLCRIFFYKSSSRTKHYWHCIIGFLIDTALLNAYFTCTTIYFFVKNFVMFHSMLECLYIFSGWERGHQLSTYAIHGEMRGHPKCVQLPKKGRSVKPHVYVCTYTIAFRVFDLNS